VQTDLPATTPGAAPLGFIDASKIITVDFVMKLADRFGAEKFAKEAVRAGSPSYYQFLTPEQFAERFRATQTDYDAMRAWASASGLTLLESSRGRTLVWAQGTVAQLSKLLGVRFRDYQDTTGRVYSRADAGATVPDEIAGRITGIVGLNRFADKVPLARMLPRGAHGLIAAIPAQAVYAYGSLSNLVVPGRRWRVLRGIFVLYARESC
jgi:subtilase family serine protease